MWLERALYAAGCAFAARKNPGGVFQRGAADGLNMVVPFGETSYYAAAADHRDSAAAAAGEDSAIDLDGFFGLHPALAPLKPIYDQGHLAIVHAVGSPDPTRSHFDAQDYMESGTPGPQGHRRRLDEPRAAGPRGGARRRCARWPRPGAAAGGARRTTRPWRWQTWTISRCATREAAAHVSRACTRGLGDAAAAAPPGARHSKPSPLLQASPAQPYTPAARPYPRGRLGQSLQQIAQLIKADVGLEMAFADVGGWDNHVNEVGQRASEGQLAMLLGEFGQALAAFWQDLGDRMEDVVVVTMSEFGRTARENGNRGTDHGHANCMFVMGGAGARRQGVRRVARAGAGAALRSSATWRSPRISATCSASWWCGTWATPGWKRFFRAIGRASAGC